MICFVLTISIDCLLRGASKMNFATAFSRRRKSSYLGYKYSLRSSEILFDCSCSDSGFFFNFLCPNWGSFCWGWLVGSLTHFAMQRRKSKSNFALKSAAWFCFTHLKSSRIYWWRTGTAWGATLMIRSFTSKPSF